MKRGKLVKKLTAFVLFSAVALSMFTACSSSGTDESAASGAQSNASAESAIEKIKQAGVLKVGVKADVPKYGYKNTDGEFEGFEVDLAKKIAGKILVMKAKLSFKR
ncbi:MAG: hypothetical protein ACFWTN_03945 [Clostridium sp.]|jgi:aspartate/glutamate/glutamine transport system substrate-binding protein